jgi:hypothetical protein
VEEPDPREEPGEASEPREASPRTALLEAGRPGAGRQEVSVPGPTSAPRARLAAMLQGVLPDLPRRDPTAARWG